ncbi:hypothetical protein DFH06DRAFT_1143134 [Mycena polygramma]|nr:hypothetical protein DFH06DRAFT_1143134 [Mycena polygramma]
MTPRVAEHSKDLGAAESADSAGFIRISGGNIGDGTGTEGQRTIRTDRTCGSWKAGKCWEPGGNPEGEGVSEDERDTEVKPEKDRRDRRTTIEEEEDVEKRRMMTEATGGGRSIGPGENRKVNRDNRKRRKPRRRSKVDTEAHGSARGRNVPERPKSRSSREGRKRESAWPHGRKLAQKSFFGPELGPEPRAGSRSDVGWGIGKESGKRNASRKFRSGKRRIGRPEYRPSWMENDLKQVKAEGHRRRKKEVKGRREDGKPPTSSGSDSGPRPRKPKPERELENCHIVEFGLGFETAQAGTGRKEGMWKETKEITRPMDRIGGEQLGSENGMRRADHWWINAQSRRLGDLESELLQPRVRGRDVRRHHSHSGGSANKVQIGQRILAERIGLETRRLVEGKVNAKSSKVGSEVGSGEIREGSDKEMEEQGMSKSAEETAKGMGNRNNEKGRNLREMHEEGPIGRTTRRKSSTCSETTNSESESRTFGSEESEVGRCVRNRKSSAESVVRIQNPEVGSQIRNDKGENRRKTAQEVLVHSESANNSSEQKSEIIGKARKFEMPIPPLRVDVPSSSARFQLFRGREAQRARDSTAGEKRLPECNRMVVDSSMQGSEGAEASDEVLEEPKHLTNLSREATAKTEVNARMFGRVPMARAAEAEHDRKESPNGESPEDDDG